MLPVKLFTFNDVADVADHLHIYLAVCLSVSFARFWSARGAFGMQYNIFYDDRTQGGRAPHSTLG